MTWPERRAICLDCRTALLDAGEPHGGHTVVSLRSSRARRRFVDRVWGPPVLTEQARGYPWIHAAALLLGVSLCILVFEIGAAPSIVVTAICAAILATVLGMLASSLTSSPLRILLGRRRRHPLPATKSPSAKLLVADSAGDDPDDTPADTPTMTGRVTATHTAPSPLTGTPAVAFAISLSMAESGSEDFMLHDGGTLGFTITTADGQDITIPRGRVEILASESPRPVAPEVVANYLSTLDPLRGDSSDGDPFTHHTAIEIVIRPGDHVRLHNRVQALGFASEDLSHPSYRHPPPRTYAIRGVPRLERIPSAETAVAEHRLGDGA